MSIEADIFRLSFGLLLGIILPRVPLLFFTRFLNLERNLPPHPDPIPVDEHLVLRLLLMRRVHIMCWIIALLPLILGVLVLKSSPEPFAFGLVAGVAWFAISRGVPLEIERGFGVLPLSLIQDVNNLREPDVECCNGGKLQWEVRSIRCQSCRKIVMNIPRPDLGRMRSEGRFIGSLRVLLMDGNSAFPPLEESIIGQGVELLGKVTEEE